MTRTHLNFTHPSPRLKTILGCLIIGLSALAFPAIADEATAALAINRAEARIEMVTRRAGISGDLGNQSSNMARQRLSTARAELKSNHYDRAERLAVQAALLASLSNEHATLAALRTNNNNLIASSLVAPTH